MISAKCTTCGLRFFFLGDVTQFWKQLPWVKSATLSLYFWKASRLKLHCFIWRKSGLFARFLLCKIWFGVSCSHCFAARFLHTSWFYITAGTHVCGYRFGFSKGVPWTLNAFCMNIFALMPFGQTQVWARWAWSASDRCVLGHEHGSSSTGPTVTGGARGKGVTELWHALLRHPPYVSNFTVVSFISFSVSARTVS